mmetsp:Transcript_37143/g.79981  ORF Transcript_37143/g.79981 Transcript_37143/m.79981 type:complete len:90 (+) Transcript_37143:238-507(+)
MSSRRTTRWKLATSDSSFEYDRPSCVNFGGVSEADILRGHVRGLSSHIDPSHIPRDLRSEVVRFYGMEESDCSRDVRCSEVPLSGFARD